jgi:hypothetical protein
MQQERRELVDVLLCVHRSIEFDLVLRIRVTVVMIGDGGDAEEVVVMVIEEDT